MPKRQILFSSWLRLIVNRSEKELIRKESDNAGSRANSFSSRWLARIPRLLYHRMSQKPLEYKGFPSFWSNRGNPEIKHPKRCTEQRFWHAVHRKILVSKSICFTSVFERKICISVKTDPWTPSDSIREKELFKEKELVIPKTPDSFLFKLAEIDW